MAGDTEDLGELKAGVAGNAALPILDLLDQDVLGGMLAGLSAGHAFVVLSGRDGPDAALLPIVLESLHSAGYATVVPQAPLIKPAVLHDAIRKAMTAEIPTDRPLLVVLTQAETLSVRTVRQLAALADLRRENQPVLRFLLVGTSDLWSILEGADLGNLEADPTAHVRLIPDLTRQLLTPIQANPALDPPFTDIATALRIHRRPRTAPLRFRESQLGRYAALSFVGITLAGMAASWVFLTWQPNEQLGGISHKAALSPDERLAALLEREDREIALGQVSSPAGDNLIETRHQIDALLPFVSPEALHRLTDIPVHRKPPAEKSPAPPAGRTVGIIASPAAPWQPADDPIHVSLRYSRDDSLAAARTMQILKLLRQEKVAVDEPVAVTQHIGRSSLAYSFTQDEHAAIALSQRLLPPESQVRKLAAVNAVPPRPGEITVFVGSHDSSP